MSLTADDNRWGTDDGNPRIGDKSLLITKKGVLVQARRCSACKQLFVLPWTTEYMNKAEVICQRCHKKLHEKE